MYQQTIKLFGDNVDMAVACGCPCSSYIVSGRKVSEVSYIFESPDSGVEDIVDISEIEKWGCEVVSVSAKTPVL